jgi:hypothetical protein
MNGACSTNGEKKNVCRLLVRKPDGRRLLGRPSTRWMNTIKIDLPKPERDNVDWIGLAQDRCRWKGTALVNAVMNLRVP